MSKARTNISAAEGLYLFLEEAGAVPEKLMHNLSFCAATIDCELGYLFVDFHSQQITVNARTAGKPPVIVTDPRKLMPALRKQALI